MKQKDDTDFWVMFMCCVALLLFFTTPNPKPGNTPPTTQPVQAEVNP